MTSKQLGHRAAAWGDPREAPVDGDPQAWLDGYDAVDSSRMKGIDPNGHVPRIPHVCERNEMKVCNCCTACSAACWAESFEGATKRVIDATRGLFRKLVRR